MGGMWSFAKSRVPRTVKVDVPKTEVNYPPLKPPKTKKHIVFNPVRFTAVDQKAKETPREHASSYNTLVHYLTSGLPNDLHKVRSMFVWLASQHIMYDNYDGEHDVNTPLGYMKLIQADMGTYEDFFALLCRTVGIPCIVVEGNVKGATYVVGDAYKDCTRGNWNLVYLDGSWRIINPKWAIVSIGNYTSSRWQMLEKDGVQEQTNTPDDGFMYVYEMDEFYFLTEPEEHIFKCFPNSSAYQLLAEPWTREKFSAVPLVHDDFFSSGLKLPESVSGVINAPDGETELKLEFRRGPYDLKYELYFDKKSTKRGHGQGHLSRYVFVNNVRNARIFFIRFQVEGKYMLNILSGNETALCDFRIDCTGVRDQCMPFPKQPDIGWGFSVSAATAGLSNPSHESGIVDIEGKRHVNFTFKKKKDLELQANLLHNEIPPDTLEKHVHQTEKGEHVTLRVDIPDKPANSEYALEIHAKDSKDENYTNVANYLLTQQTKRQELKQNKNSNDTSLSCNGISNNVVKTNKLDKSLTRANIFSDDKGTTTMNSHPTVGSSRKEPSEPGKKGLFEGFIKATNSQEQCHSTDLKGINAVNVSTNKQAALEARQIRAPILTNVAVNTDSKASASKACQTSLDDSNSYAQSSATPAKLDAANKLPKSAASSLAKNKTYSFKLKDPKTGEFSTGDQDVKSDVITKGNQKVIKTPHSETVVKSRRQSLVSRCASELSASVSSKMSSARSSLGGSVDDVDYSLPARIKRMKEAYTPNAVDQNMPKMEKATPKVETSPAKITENLNGICNIKTPVSELPQKRHTREDSQEQSPPKTNAQKFLKVHLVPNTTPSLPSKTSFAESNAKVGAVSPLGSSDTESTQNHREHTTKEQVTRTRFKSEEDTTPKTLRAKRTFSLNNTEPGSTARKLSEREKSKSLSTDSCRCSQRQRVDSLCQDLQKAIESRKLSEINKVLAESSSQPTNEKLTELKEKAKNVRSVIKRLNIYMHEVMAVNQGTIAEIHSYSRPKQLVHDVMRATFLLLGERGSELRKWHYVQQLMRRTSKEGLIMKIQEFSMKSISLDLAAYVKEILNQHDPDEARTTSAGAGAFYIWCRHVIEEVEHRGLTESQA